MTTLSINGTPEDEKPVKLSSRVFGLILAGVTTMLAVGAWAVPDHIKLKDQFYELKPEVKEHTRTISDHETRIRAQEEHARKVDEMDATMRRIEQLILEGRGRKR